MYACMYSQLLLFIMLYLGYLGSKGRDKPSSVMRNLTFKLICVSANSASSTKTVLTSHLISVKIVLIFSLLACLFVWT